MGGKALYTWVKKWHFLMSAWHGGTMLKAIAAGKHTNQKTSHNIKYVPQVATNRTQKDIVSDVIKKRDAYHWPWSQSPRRIERLKKWPRPSINIYSLLRRGRKCQTVFNTASHYQIDVVLHNDIPLFTPIRFNTEWKKKEREGHCFSFLA